jgi:spore maturation protein CgeB
MNGQTARGSSDLTHSRCHHLNRVWVSTLVDLHAWRAGMKLVVFGLSVSSSWGNGHATLWRGLIRALAEQSHQVVFFERDVPYYAAHRDLFELPGGRLVLYPDWTSAAPIARTELADADAAMVTSYCADALAATAEVLDSCVPLRAFYDLDTPITLERLRAGQSVSYIGPGGLADFDLVLSYTGGGALTELRERLGARRVAPLYGSVDPSVHRPVPSAERYRADLSYLGTYADDRQRALVTLLVEPARLCPRRRFLIGGAQYPAEFPWTDNIYFVRHLPPSEHPAFFSSCRFTLNITRGAMAEMGYCPSGRLFEAAACGAPILSDRWEGLDHFFQPAAEIVVASTTDEAVHALELSDAELGRIAAAARERVLADHTASRRAAELISLLEGAMAVGA